MKISINEDGLVQYLKNNFNPLAVILYGSFANNAATTTSDIDVVCIVKDKKQENDNSIWEGHPLDVWTCTVDELQNVKEYLRLSDGRLIFDTANIGSQILVNVNDCFKKGPEPYSIAQLEHCRHWYEKMIARSMVLDIEGYFRRSWVLVDMLETYFRARNMWYQGPKKAFAYLKEKDLDTYNLFDKALKGNAGRTELMNLAQIILPNKQE